jgi:hypothetical protein
MTVGVSRRVSREIRGGRPPVAIITPPHVP